MKVSLHTYTLSGPEGTEIITAQSEPQVGKNSLFSREGWTCQEWITWHRELVKEHGKDRANAIFTQWWDKQGYWDYHKNTCAFGSTFVNYMVEAGLSDLIGVLSNAITKTGEAISDVFASAQNVTEGTEKLTGGLTKWWILPAIGVVLAGGGYLYYRSKRAIAKTVL